MDFRSFIRGRFKIYATKQLVGFGIITNGEIGLGQYHLAFTVDDVEALVVRLKEQGVPIALEPLSTQPDRLVAFVEDPDGAFVQLIQLLE